MGYETAFKLNGELDSKFRGWLREESPKSELEMYSTILKAKCMAEGNENKDGWYSLYKDIQDSFRRYIKLIEENWKLNLKNRLESEDYKENGIWFCGWNHARGSHASSWDSMEDIENYFIPNLFSVAVCPAGSMFDSESDKYWRKSDRMEEFLGDVEDCVWECWDNQFIEFYRDHPDLAVENGDDTPRQEEKDEQE